jgi:hypothetical protein
MLTVTDDMANLTFTWQEPLAINGPGSITYTVDTSCEDLRTGLTVLSETVMLSTREVTLMRAPYMRCSVTVTPLTDAGQGQSSSASIETPEEGKEGKGRR